MATGSRGAYRRRVKPTLIVAGCLTAFTAVALTAQSGAANGEWRSYGGDLGHTRYSPLDQINAANFNKLEVAWRFKTDNLGPRPEFSSKSTPLMVERRRSTPPPASRRAVVALDAAHRRAAVDAQRERRRARRGRAAPALRAAAWPTGPTAATSAILYVTPGYRLIALDAKTGAPVAGFGKNGVVDLKQDDDQEIDLVTGEIGLHSDADRREERRHRRRRAPDRRRPDEQDAT